MRELRQNIVLKTLCNQCPEEKAQAILRFLPESDQKQINELPSFLAREERASDHLLQHVHWSWFVPCFKEYPSKDQKLLLHALPRSTQKNLAEELNIAPAPDACSHPALTFLQDTLISKLDPKRLLLPLRYLPPSPLNLLLDLEKKKLTQLIDFLGLYDLSHELRQIVETKILKKIYSFLSGDEKKFLKLIAGKKIPFSIVRLQIDTWDGKEKTLRLKLHRRGLSHLGAALFGQNPDLIWYVCHQLDIGRGEMLHTLCMKTVVPDISAWMIERIEELTNPDMLV